MTTFIAPPTKGGGTITIDKPTRESDTTRPLWYVGWLLTIRALAALLLVGEIVLVGKAAGPLLILGALWYAADTAGIWVLKGGIPRLQYTMRAGVWRELTWVLGSLLGLALTVAAVTGYWLPVEWRVEEGLLWLVTAWGTEAILPSWYTIPVWLRYALILFMPWITWRPFALLHWVFEAESTFKNLRETSFVPADPGTIRTPLGRVRGQPNHDTPVRTETPASSAPLAAAPTGKVRLASQMAAKDAPQVDLL